MLESGWWARTDEVLIQGDRGFFGLHNEGACRSAPQTAVRRAAYRQQQADNRALASERVVCEHALRVSSTMAGHQVYRSRQEGFDDRSMVIAAELWNFYLEVASECRLANVTVPPRARICRKMLWGAIS
ncbi:MAG: hypothetical protein ACFB0E_09735 [Leptolyngbyaceae cyanobacterium]